MLARAVGQYSVTTWSTPNVTVSSNSMYRDELALGRETVPSSLQLCRDGPLFLGQPRSRAAAKTRPSQRGELEIIDLLEFYRAEGSLLVEKLGRGFTWLDTGHSRKSSRRRQFRTHFNRAPGSASADLLMKSHSWRDGSAGPTSRTSAPFPEEPLRDILKFYTSSAVIIRFQAAAVDGGRLPPWAGPLRYWWLCSAPNVPLAAADWTNG